ncbi:hypothetical protein SUGI_0149530 [Cryptomeria japonica]|uniref:squamosa promoter-binding-like protein 12 n=1 Tax=Cryptomeria japonica TaxID=3369 RepID=UPI002408CB6A|nr:squamosa promoter-binding-like protein 12 [Cryptomeria japonica]GLJ11262.1 hypothetical protein SUGI_0149530 [Cryptomeria japonica]
MDWDMKAPSSHWDWDNLMLFPNRGADFGKKAQWENDTVAANGNAEMDNSSMQNGSVYSLGCGSGSTLAYGSSSKSSASVEFSTEVEADPSKIKVESIESGYTENRNVGFLDLRSQTDPKTTGLDNGKSSEMKPHGELNGFCVREQQESQRSFVGKEFDKIDKTNASLTVAASTGSGGDSHIGLKLGKRTYFEDVSASSGIPIKAAPSLGIPVTPSVSTKRHRGLSQSMQSPRCQVEGCNADLSSVKDYHRRHKVCEAHSKSSMVIVNNQEQRFCQQCSRFHVLSEFDDGKRSCRRRLAGHNERRRKPQLDSIALNSSRSGSSFYDSYRTGLLMDRSSFMPQRIFSSSVLDGYNDFKLGHGKGIWPRIVKTEDQLIFDGHLQTPSVNQQSYINAVSLPPAEKRYLLFQSSKAASGDVLSQDIHNYTWNQTNPVTQAPTFSSSSGMEVPGGLEMASATGMLSGVSLQRRALSLLSSQSRSSRAPGSSSLDLAPRPGFALEQFMHENHSTMTQIPVPEMQHNFSPVTDKFLSISSQPSTGLVSNGYPAPGGSSLDKVNQGGSLIPNMGGIGNFEGPIHDLLRGQEMRSSHDSRSKDVRSTINLMQRSSQVQSNESQERSGIGQHGNRQLMEFQLMRCYEPSVFDSQHMQ